VSGSYLALFFGCWYTPDAGGTLNWMPVCLGSPVNSLPRIGSSARTCKLLKQIAADRCGFVWLLCITLVGAVVWIWFLNQPMRQDEAQTYLSFVAQGVDRLSHYQASNNHVVHTLPIFGVDR
jgi:hypothetical protein